MEDRSSRNRRSGTVPKPAERRRSAGRRTARADGAGRRLVLAAALIASGGTAQAAEPVIPQYAEEMHEGVSSCDGSTCHGSAGERNDRSVLQNEYSTWVREDRHATRAYKILLEPVSIQISRNLGRTQKPHEDALCLDCHADHPPVEKRRTEKNAFRVDDGVGCEACHGGAERYLRPHDGGLPHAKNLELGMYPTDDPVARTRLCLSCHFGDRRKFVDHRLMGAGHPRQSFEVALFSILQPYHWEPDDDYRERGKQAPNDVQLWAIGQAVAVDQVLDAMVDPERNDMGSFPELVLYDCHACHHPIDAQRRWRPRPSTGLGPGVPRLNDANFLMLMQSAERVDAVAAKKLRTDLRALHQAASEGRGDSQALVRRIRADIAALLPKLRAWKVDAAALRALTKNLLAEAVKGEFSDYAGSEQTAMALQSVLYSSLVAGVLDDAAYEAIERSELAGVLAAVQDPDKFDPDRARRAFQKLQLRLGSR